LCFWPAVFARLAVSHNILEHFWFYKHCRLISHSIATQRALLCSSLSKLWRLLYRRDSRAHEF